MLLTVHDSSTSHSCEEWSELNFLASRIDASRVTLATLFLLQLTRHYNSPPTNDSRMPPNLRPTKRARLSSSPYALNDENNNHPLQPTSSITALGQMFATSMFGPGSSSQVKEEQLTPKAEPVEEDIDEHEEDQAGTQQDQPPRTSPTPAVKQEQQQEEVPSPTLRATPVEEERKPVLVASTSAAVVPPQQQQQAAPTSSAPPTTQGSPAKRTKAEIEANRRAAKAKVRYPAHIPSQTTGADTAPRAFGPPFSQLDASRQQNPLARALQQEQKHAGYHKFASGQLEAYGVTVTPRGTMSRYGSGRGGAGGAAGASAPRVVRVDNGGQWDAPLGAGPEMGVLPEVKEPWAPSELCSEEQLEVLKQVREGKNVFFTGSAGSLRSSRLVTS